MSDIILIDQRLSYGRLKKGSVANGRTMCRFTKNIVADRASSSSNSDMSAVFQEIEQWETVLKSEPEAIRKLRDFTKASRPASEDTPQKQRPKPISRTRGPSH